MNTKAIRLYGVDDIRLEEFSLPEITEDEVLIRVVSDSVCASTYKAIRQGPAHKRVPADVAENPIIIGHEMCGQIVEVGENVKIWGRIQSREYQKKIDEDNIITKTAYEISISKMDVSSKPDIQFEII